MQGTQSETPPFMSTPSPVLTAMAGGTPRLADSRARTSATELTRASAAATTAALGHLLKVHQQIGDLVVDLVEDRLPPPPPLLPPPPLTRRASLPSSRMSEESLGRSASNEGSGERTSSRSRSSRTSSVVEWDRARTDAADSWVSFQRRHTPGVTNQTRYLSASPSSSYQRPCTRPRPRPGDFSSLSAIKVGSDPPGAVTQWPASPPKRASDSEFFALPSGEKEKTLLKDGSYEDVPPPMQIMPDKEGCASGSDQDGSFSGFSFGGEGNSALDGNSTQRSFGNTLLSFLSRAAGSGFFADRSSVDVTAAGSGTVENVVGRDRAVAKRCETAGAPLINTEGNSQSLTPVSSVVSFVSTISMGFSDISSQIRGDGRGEEARPTRGRRDKFRVTSGPPDCIFYKNGDAEQRRLSYRRRAVQATAKQLYSSRSGESLEEDPPPVLYVLGGRKGETLPSTLTKLTSGMVRSDSYTTAEDMMPNTEISTPPQSRTREWLSLESLTPPLPLYSEMLESESFSLPESYSTSGSSLSSSTRPSASDKDLSWNKTRNDLTRNTLPLSLPFSTAHDEELSELGSPAIEASIVDVNPTPQRLPEAYPTIGSLVSSSPPPALREEDLSAPGKPVFEHRAVIDFVGTLSSTISTSKELDQKQAVKKMIHNSRGTLPARGCLPTQGGILNMFISWSSFEHDPSDDATTFSETVDKHESLNDLGLHRVDGDMPSDNNVFDTSAGRIQGKLVFDETCKDVNGTFHHLEGDPRVKFEEKIHISDTGGVITPNIHMDADLTGQEDDVLTAGLALEEGGALQIHGVRENAVASYSHSGRIDGSEGGATADLAVGSSSKSNSQNEESGPESELGFRGAADVAVITSAAAAAAAKFAADALGPPSLSPSLKDPEDHKISPEDGKGVNSNVFESPSSGNSTDASSLAKSTKFSVPKHLCLNSETGVDGEEGPLSILGSSGGPTSAISLSSEKYYATPTANVYQISKPDKDKSSPKSTQVDAPVDMSYSIEIGTSNGTSPSIGSDNDVVFRAMLVVAQNHIPELTPNISPTVSSKHLLLTENPVSTSLQDNQDPEQTSTSTDTLTSNKVFKDESRRLSSGFTSSRTSSIYRKTITKPSEDFQNETIEAMESGMRTTIAKETMPTYFSPHTRETNSPLITVGNNSRTSKKYSDPPVLPFVSETSITHRNPRLCFFILVCMFCVIAAAVGMGLAFGGTGEQDYSNPYQPINGTLVDPEPPSGVTKHDKLFSKQQPPPSATASSQTRVNSRAARIIEIISQVSGDLTNNPKTPQGRALTWMVELDSAPLIIDDCFVVQRYILAVIYFALGGDNWTLKGSFLDEATNECQWFGVRCSGGVVNHLNLSGAGLNGEFPVEITKLDSLEYLNLRANSISGGLPESIGDLHRLTTLDMSSNKLSKKIPESIGKMRDLSHLNLKQNFNITGHIPLSLMKLKKLVRLSLDNNSLSGSIPNFESMESLEILEMQKNQLHGSIPLSVGQLHSLRLLKLFGNALTGSIPESIGNLENIEELHLYANKLSGRIPTSMGGMKSLYSLSIFENSLSGEIPGSLGKLKNLLSASLDSNNLVGIMPEEFCALRIEGSLGFLSADCAGNIPEVQCSCCTNCF